MIHAMTLLCILLFARPGQLHSHGGLAGILMIVCTTWASGAKFLQLLRLTKTDISVWMVTFALTVFADLTVLSRLE